MSKPITDLASFKEFLRDRTHETWDELKIPYYLSVLGSDLEKKGVKYRDFTGPLRLAQWLAHEKIPETKLIVHPHHKAKVGLLPSEVIFNFEEDDSGESIKKSQKRNQSEKALIDFVKAFSVLPEEALESYEIPAKILLAFLKK